MAPKNRAKRASRALLSALAVAACSLTFSAPAEALGPIDQTIYTPTPGWAAQPHGTKLQHQQVNTSLLTSLVDNGFPTSAVTAWRISYTTTAPDADLVATRPGRPQLATGIVLVPNGVAWTKSLTRPIVVFAPKTQGIGLNCAPSKALQLGKEELSEVKRLLVALNAGYVVAVTDYDGYSNGVEAHQYLVGQANGHAVLDMALATKTLLSDVATQVSSYKVSPNAPLAIWGYSEGGSAATWAGQLVSSYAPSLLTTLKAVAAGGPVVDLQGASVRLDSSPGAGMLLSGVWGFHNAYPKPFSQGGVYFDVNDNFKRDLLGDEAATKYGTTAPTASQAGYLLNPDTCVDQLGMHALKSMVWRNYGFYRITQLTGLPELHWDAVLKANNPGAYKIPVPFYYYHGSFSTTLDAGSYANDGDGILTYQSFNNFFDTMCANQTDVWKEVVPSTFYGNSNHESSSDKAFATVSAWLERALLGQTLSFEFPDTVASNGVKTKRRCPGR